MGDIGLNVNFFLNVGEMSMIVDGIEWVIIWSGGSSRQHGVATCFRMCDKYKNRIEIGGFQQISDRLLAVDCSISGTQVRLINGYAPTNCYSLVQKEIFYENLLKLATMSQGSKRKIICLGDFNNYASVLHENCCFDGNLERLDSYECTESGQLFLDFHSTVYKACIDRNLFSELDDRGIVFASKQREIE